MMARAGPALIFFLAALAQAQTPARPNVVLIVTDNHGAWSIGPYGNRDGHTPHLDGMAQEGVTACTDSSTATPNRNGIYGTAAAPRPG